MHFTWVLFNVRLLGEGIFCLWIGSAQNLCILYMWRVSFSAGMWMGGEVYQTCNKFVGRMEVIDGVIKVEDL